ncbi:protein RRP5 homolog [Trichonephila clavipes]|nr:protein RRP5 homolog [Trichonephila clavipes]
MGKSCLNLYNFRKDDEKLNVWKALLNLEARYGTKESLFSIFEDALKYNDKKKTYFHLLELLIDAEKTEEIESFSQRILKHFKSEKDVHLILCTYYMKAGKTKEARNIYKRCLQCVPQKEYPDVMGKFAYLEHEHGDIERSLSLTATAGSDVVQSGRPIFDNFFQHLWPYIGNKTANVVFQMVKRLWLIHIDQ